MAEELDVLFIAAHRDDTEIVCGGTVIKLVDLGYQVGLLDLTAGEMGTRGTAADREAEAAEAARIMGLAARENLGLPDAGLRNIPEYQKEIVKVLRRGRPRMVVLPYWKQRHPDHREAGNLGYDACYLAGLQKYDAPGEPHRPTRILYSSNLREVRHSFLVDITDQFERKMDAVAAYHTQFGTREGAREIFNPGVDIFSFMETSTRHLGHQIGVKYAEGFTIKENIVVDDPLKLAGRSI
ncbi:bacillithiol biosynthesis deacetylase BshB1 [Candidatus Zixiibacteriota bacterium]